MTAEGSEWERVQRFIGREAMLLDTRQWDKWLELYGADCEYWIPSWRSDGQLVTDPHTELSLIYYPNRVGLEGRVFRIRTGKASSAAPSPRTAHVSQLVDLSVEDSLLRARTNWTVSSVAENRVTTHFGYSLYVLEARDATLAIKSKTTVIANDMIHEVLDFYNV
ncbi:aromatic-ring-hydroxylating dioxygenase subunit beta [Caballeronia mineralivorans]|jgi:benzoate/toluate 1,2-dioxygenase beta subunit|uniref:aromatic-ring-hydroxylating dioxygenase subunit beta n=1 Tax=Caballeronia mineralivorans TaxID=2010198 RepID=UPI0023F17F06|nr:aromatic-ring-hydroxylating dioxygenase subunit beta [Caballeronia mineralivorans]MDB5784440.1 benzene 1,2-dioxygenase [Caballeronia mineralivorans]MEA3101724.1 benzoate/toluate 1,2-dioxygenase subunit beta [Caballeronia mineralivorans]